MEVRGVGKRFAGVTALDNVSTAFRAGQCHALVGRNGAGKSTLIKVLAGAQAPDGGTVWWAGRPVRTFDPQSMRKLGVATVHQEFTLVPQLTVAENISLGREPSTLGVINQRRRLRAAQAAVDALGVHVDPRQRVGRLSVGLQQLIEIAKALASDARLLILDEPTASLTTAETGQLFRAVRRLTAAGVAVVYISHRLEEVERLADQVTVLRDGRVEATLRRGEYDRTRLIAAMTGTAGSVQARAARAPVARGAAMLTIAGLATDVLSGVDLTVHAGEMVGLAGLVGSGRSEVLRAVFGADRLRGGVVRVAGHLAGGSPVRAMRAGAGYAPEDRRHDGLVLEMSVRDNIALAALPQLARRGVVRTRPLRAAAAGLIDQLQIKVGTPASPARTLSGGNQQKVVLAKWLATGCRVLLVDEPTRGVDVAAKQEIYRMLRAFADAGGAVLFVTSEAGEFPGVADRVVVLRAGRSVLELTGDQITEQSITRLVESDAGSAGPAEPVEDGS